MTLDFIRDIGDTLQSQGLQYFIIAIQERKKDSRVDFFRYVKNKNGLLVLEQALKDALAEVDKLKGENENEE